jgi:penicillin-binding protein 1A
MTPSPTRPRRFAAALLLVAVAATGCSYTTRDALPPTPISAESSTLFAADGTRLHTFHAEENRSVVALDEMPTHLRNAVVAIEDERFYRHNGIDVRAVARAVRANTEAGEVAEGGSTITQQYVKKVLLQDDSQTVERKLREAALALQLERHYSKDRILELYLNAVYFGNGAYGVEAAANQYFGKSVRDITLAEAAMLAGQVQRPTATDPYDRPDAAVTRRDVVLERMRELRYAPDEEIDAALQEPLTLGDPTTPAAERYEAAYFVEEVKQWILDDPRFGSTPQQRRDLLFGGGLRIQTTVDLAAQRAAEAAATEVLPDPAEDPDVGLVAVEPDTGFVRAMVGGRDFFGPGAAAKLNLATQNRRQTGSAFKPFVLAAALLEGMSPRTVYAAPGCVSIPDVTPAWKPCNYSDSGPPGVVDLVEGTVRSYNTLYAQLIMDVGAEDAMEAASELGVRSPLEAVPSSVLGANIVTPVDMAAGFATFANHGIRVPPVLVTRITRSDGTVLFKHEHAQRRVLDAGIADTVTSILEQVVQRGTGTAARLDRPAAGKTGTDNDYENAWFVGFTPELVTSVWVGYHEGDIPMEPPRTPIRVTGGSYPAQIWQRFMSAALAGRPVTAFTPPPSDAFTPPPYEPGQPDPLDELDQELQDEIEEYYAQHPEIDPSRPLPVPGQRPPVDPSRPGDPTTTTTRRSGPTPTSPTTAPDQGRIKTVPHVTGQHVDSAMATLQAAGFRVVRRAAHGNVRAGTVVAQSPPGGSLAPEGSSVTIGVVGG